MKAEDAEWTLDHEVVHALRELGLIRDAEWTTLAKSARADTERMAAMRSQREGQGLTEEDLIEEVVADMFADWATGRTEAGGFLKTAFQRIRNFLTAVGQAFRGRGYTTMDDPFLNDALAQVRPNRLPRLRRRVPREPRGELVYRRD